MPKEEVFDVAVVGGGSAGVAASLAASRLGARTLLVERCDILGGNATGAFVHTICGLYLPAGGATDAQPAHPGLPQHFADALVRAGAAGDVERAGRVFVLSTEPTRMAAFEADLCKRARNLSLRLNAELVGAELTASPGGQSALALGDGSTATARVVIDTSGDAAAAALGGAELEGAAPEILQFPSFIFRLAGVDTRELEGFGRLRLTHAVAGAARARELPPGCESVLVRRGLAAGEVYVTLNLPKLAGRAYDPLDAEYAADLHQQAVASAQTLVEFLIRSRPAFAKARIAELPGRVGIRETRRVAGLASVQEEDVLAARRRPDEVAVSTWPIELWHDHRRAEFTYPEGPSSIPLGALISRSHPLLGMAGRCLSASHEALGALRVIGTALATGEAIGTAAALAADAGTVLAAVEPARVRDTIREWAERERFFDGA